MTDNILIIKLGALGDFVQAAASFASIRAHHKNANIALLTSPPYAEFASKSPWFDEIWVDLKPSLFNVKGWWSLRSRLNSRQINRVYDLQTSDRTQAYFRLFWPKTAPEWSGIAKGCSHPHNNPLRDTIHTIERLSEQLEMANVKCQEPHDFAWITGSISHLKIGSPFAVLAPGGSAHRPEKRWAPEMFRQLAKYLETNGLNTVVIGSSEEIELADNILRGLNSGVNLAGKTSLEDLFLISREAVCAVGNDTGPMHIFASELCPTLVLYSDASEPALCAQRGANVQILKQKSLQTMKLNEVIKHLAPILLS